MAGHRRNAPHVLMSTPFCFALALCLLLAAASLTHAARSLPHKDYYDLTWLQHVAGALVEMKTQSGVHAMHAHEFIDVVARELVATSPTASTVAHTDYICADSC